MYAGRFINIIIHSNRIEKRPKFNLNVKLVMIERQRDNVLDYQKTKERNKKHRHTHTHTTAKPKDFFFQTATETNADDI